MKVSILMVLGIFNFWIALALVLWHFYVWALEDDYEC